VLAKARLAIVVRKAIRFTAVLLGFLLELLARPHAGTPLRPCTLRDDNAHQGCKPK